MNVQVEFLPKAIARIEAERAKYGDDAHFVLVALRAAYGATTRFAHGTHELTIAGLKVTNTAGGINLINAWAARAKRIIAEQAG